MKVKFFEPGVTYQALKPEFQEAIERVLSNGDLILRQDVEDFEKSLAEFVGTKYAVALNSCTDALYLALRKLKIGPGDQVLVPSRTFVASAQVIVQVGAEPLYYDTDGNFACTPDYKKKLKAIIPVHIEGAIDTNFDKMLALSKELNIPIIEDAAQALGATHKGKGAGSIGLAGCFSFYPAKILGAFGDAGALVTDDEEMYEYVKEARNHFKNDARDWGINSRLDNLQAAILNVRFAHLHEMLKRREEIANMYGKVWLDKKDDGKNIRKFVQAPLHTPGRVWQDYIIRCKDKDERDNLYAFLKGQGIETLKNNYPFPVPKLPLAQAYEDETLRLPCNENLTDEEIDYVIEKINEFYK